MLRISAQGQGERKPLKKRSLPNLSCLVCQQHDMSLNVTRFRGRHGLVGKALDFYAGGHGFGYPLRLHSNTIRQGINL